MSQEFYATNKSRTPLLFIRPDGLDWYLDCHGEYVRSCDVTDGNEHVSVATTSMKEMARDVFSGEISVANFSTTYVLCRTFTNYIPGFDLLESRLLSCNSPECPLLLVTLYRSGGVDGILEHIKHLTVMCSSPLQRIRVPKVRVSHCVYFPLKIRNQRCVL